MLLLCGAGLLLRTLVALGTVDPGYRARDVLTMVIAPGMSRTPEALLRFYEAVEREVGGLPGVRSVGWGSALPLDGMWYGQAFQIVGDPPKPEANRDGAGYQIVSASYLHTLDIPLLAGRGFTDHDTSGGVQVCIVNEAFVRRYLGSREPLGMQLNVQALAQPPQAVVREIVGVVSHVRERPDEAEAQPHVYVPLAQNPWWSATLVVQPSEGPADALTSAVRAAVARVDRDLPATRVRTLDEVASQATSRPRFRAVLVVTFAVLALGLAMVGVFGVLAYAVQQRWRELGVRVALGATPRDVLAIVFASASRVIVAGALVGLAAAAALGQTMATFLFGVEPLDPVTFGSVVLVLMLTAAVATASPALRAIRVDPVIAFREE